MTEDSKEAQEFAEERAKEIEGPVTLNIAMGISDDRVRDLERFTRDLCRHASTVADCLMAIATCGNFNDTEKVFCTHQWTKGFIANEQQKAYSRFRDLKVR
jgi:hypothetical protein